jgi:hypothetical protein
MKPLARLMLQSGITYKQFADVLKLVFVEEATGVPDSRGRITNISRVAIKTGLSRKEVARLREWLAVSDLSGEGIEDSHFHSGIAARVLQVWFSDPAFADAGGRPLDLPAEGASPTFSDLVKLVGGDVPVGAVRTELISAGAIMELPGDQLRALKRHFVPSDVGEELIVGIESFAMPVLAGLARNVMMRDQPPFIQRFAYSDRLPEAAIPVFRKLARDSSADFVQSIDNWLASSEIAPDQSPESPRRVGVGVFYFEEE